MTEIEYEKLYKNISHKIRFNVVKCLQSQKTSLVEEMTFDLGLNQWIKFNRCLWGRRRKKIQMERLVSVNL